MQHTHSIEGVLNTPQQNRPSVAAADGRLSTDESDFLPQTSNKLGLQPEQVMLVADNLRD